MYRSGNEDPSTVNVHGSRIQFKKFFFNTCIDFNLGGYSEKSLDVFQCMFSQTEVRYDSVDWIHVAQDMGQWRALLNTKMNLQVP
jgi:hypothetical protein